MKVRDLPIEIRKDIYKYGLTKIINYDGIEYVIYIPVDMSIKEIRKNTILKIVNLTKLAKSSN